MEDKILYQMSGSVIKRFKATNNFKKMFKILKELHEKNTPPVGFEWKCKYPNTFDLRPNVYDIDDCFINVLLENKIIKKLRHFSGVSDLMLAHIQIRKSSKGPSYMDWHRDVYFVDGKLTGNFPPTHKLIFYPKISHNFEPKLNILEGSHNCMLTTQTSQMMVSPGFSQFDQHLFQVLKVMPYSNSEDEYILFNTSGLHAVVPDTEDEGSIRIIYSFASKDYFKHHFSDQPLHTNLSKKYADLC